tara:strand:- start:315 stop:425 length:111 start_codon:yes stop_codon:yes gene_type:complete
MRRTLDAISVKFQRPELKNFIKISGFKKYAVALILK